MSIIKLTKEQQELIFNRGNVIWLTNGDKYAFLPFWYKENKNDSFDEIYFENLPQEVVNKARELEWKKPICVCKNCGKEGFYLVYERGDESGHYCPSCVVRINDSVLLKPKK